MSFYVVIRKSIKDGFFPENTKNPTEVELLKDLQAYSQIYLLTSLEAAEKIADIFFINQENQKWVVLMGS